MTTTRPSPTPRAQRVEVSGELFQALGTPALVGRTLLPPGQRMGN